MSYDSVWNRPGWKDRGDNPLRQVPKPTEAQVQAALLHIVQAAIRAKEQAESADDETANVPV